MATADGGPLTFLKPGLRRGPCSGVVRLAARLMQVVTLDCLGMMHVVR
jgi:hypothetical protein